MHAVHCIVNIIQDDKMIVHKTITELHHESCTPDTL